MKNLKTIDFLKGSASKNLTALFVPLLIAFFFSMAFDINDSLWIGNLLGEKALAAQTVSMPLILIYNAVCMGITGGIAILLSQAIGAKRAEETETVIATSFIALEYVAAVEHPEAVKLNTCGGEIEQSRRQDCTLTV